MAGDHPPAAQAPQPCGKRSHWCAVARGNVHGCNDAAVHTIIRKVTAPALFDETPVGLRRRRTMAEGMERLEALAAAGKFDTSAALLLDVMAVVVALDYLDFRFAQAPWLRPMPALRTIAATFFERPAVTRTRPHCAVASVVVRERSPDARFLGLSPRRRNQLCGN